MSLWVPPRGAAPFGRLAAAAGGIPWVNISEAFGVHSGDVLSYGGTAGVGGVSFSSDATSTVFEIQNDVAVDGFREAPSRSLPMTTVFPEFVNDGRWHLTLLGIAVSSFAGSVASKWQGCGITDIPDASAVGAMLGFRNSAGAQYTALFSATGWTITSGSSSPVRGIVSRLLGSATFFGALWTNSSFNSVNGGAVSDAPHLTIAAGCDSTGSTGPHTTEVQWWGFVAETPDTAPA